MYSVRVRSKELKLKGKMVFIDLEINQKGLYFHVKDLSAKDYILLDLSGLDEFLIRLNHFVETNIKGFFFFFFLSKFNNFFVNKNIIQSLFNFRGTHLLHSWKKNVYRFGRLKASKITLLLFQLTGWLFLLNMISMSPTSTLERQRQLMSYLQRLLDHPRSSSHEPSCGSHA